MSELFQYEATAFLAWLGKTAIPFWKTHGADPQGGVFEALDHDGNPLLNAPKRLRVQARQTFSFAKAERMGWISSGRAASDHAWRFLVDHGQQTTPCDHQAFAHILDHDGKVIDDKIDLYDTAFVLLAATERELAFGDPEAKAIASDAISLLTTLRSPQGGFDEGRPASLPRRTNPHMHLFEVCILRRDELDCVFATEVVEEIKSLWNQKFWDPKCELLREFFEQDWSHHRSQGATIEPGHMVEWLCLLDAAGGLTDSFAETIYQRARAVGLRQSVPILADTYDLLSDTKGAGSRLWSQTELIRATAVLARRTGSDHYRDETARLLAAFRKLYLDDVAAGGWYDRLDSSGSAVSDRMPASLLYHFVTLGEELERQVIKLS